MDNVISPLDEAIKKVNELHSELQSMAVILSEFEEYNTELLYFFDGCRKPFDGSRIRFKCKTAVAQAIREAMREANLELAETSKLITNHLTPAT